MTREDFHAHREALQRFLGLVHQFTAAIVLVTFAAYALAGYLWWQGAGLPALLLATLAYLFFRAFRPVSMRLARWRFAGSEGNEAALALLARELEQRRARDVLSEIEGWAAAAAREGQGHGH